MGRWAGAEVKSEAGSPARPRAARFGGRLDDLSDAAWESIQTLIEADEAKHRRGGTR